MILKGTLKGKTIAAWNFLGPFVLKYRQPYYQDAFSNPTNQGAAQIHSNSLFDSNSIRDSALPSLF